jgi:hypothetical protein
MNCEPHASELPLDLVQQQLEVLGIAMKQRRTRSRRATFSV